MKTLLTLLFVPLASCLAQTTNQPPFEKSWDQPRYAEVSISWEPSPDAATYRVYMRSARTTNQWTVVGRDVTGTSFAFAADLSVPVWTKVTAVSEARSESPATNPVKHPAISPPRPPGQHRHMYTRELRSELEVRRARAVQEPMPPLPQ